MYIIVDFTIKARTHTTPMEVLELEDMRPRMVPYDQPAQYLQGSAKETMA